MSSDLKSKIVLSLLVIGAMACFAAAIFGPILWPDLGRTTTVTVIPGCWPQGDR